MIDDVPQRFGNLADVLLGAGILDVEDLIAALLFEVAAERVHRRVRANQPVQHNHGLAVHFRQVAIALDAVQCRFAFLVGAPGVAEIAAVQEPAMAGKHIPLDAPLMEEELVAPELLSPHRRHGNEFHVARARLAAGQPPSQARQSCENHQNDAGDAPDHEPLGVAADGI